jgi:putative nucleotidyltransferase with HDIG domain
MVGHRDRLVTDGRRSDRTASLVVAALLGVCLAAVVVTAPADRVNGLSIILLVGALAAGLLVAGEQGGLSISASFLVYVLAGAFLGVRSAAAVAVITELVASLRMHTRARNFVLVNLPACVVPAIVGALICRGIAPAPAGKPSFYVGVAVAAIAAITLSFMIFATLCRAFSPELPQFGIATFVEDLPSALLNVLLLVAGAGITVKLGHAGIAYALAAVFSFSYMSHLLARARRRSEQYVSLSWGVLAGLMRSLDIRDERAARHAAAVARFARDMAHAVGMDEHEQELAHTAGLLHDIGTFALSDRVAERGRALTDEDWVAIQRHPQLGADMLKDLGMYGPVAEIVLAHHERIDGRGYPRMLEGDEIPEIAKIIAVAEVYDTLTASDTYRTQMSSFEALRELRRVADTQLDARYVEVLAELLSGEGIEYRHADTADFDSELDMERRIREASGGR